MSSAPLALLRRPSVWPHLAQDALWKWRSSEMASPAPTWPVEEDFAAQLTLWWPEQYGADHAARWLDPLRTGLSRHVKIEPAAIPQPHRRLTVIGAGFRGRSYPVALDFSDYADEINAGCARSCLAYFKMQFLREGYGSETIVPGGYVPGRAHIYRFLPRARALADRRRYRYEVYGRFSPHFAPEVRARALEALRTQDRFAYEGDLQLVTYARFLREVASAKVCVDLPGNGDLCHRLIDYLAVGACVVGVEPITKLHVPLEPGAQITYAARDLSDLVDVCEGLLDDAEAREARRAAARDFFDRYLHVDQLAGYYLHRLRGALEGAAASA